MSLTRAQLETFLDNDLDVPASGNAGPLSALQYINQAGILLCNLYGWRWLNRAGTTLNFVAGQAYVDLPSDLLRLHTITPAALGEEFVLLDFDRFIQNEKQGTQPSGYYGYVGTNVGTLNAVTLRLFLHPTPSANLTGALMLKYRAGWTEIASGDAAGTLVAIPDFVEPLYLEMLRAVVYGYEENMNGGVDARVSAIKASATYKSTVARDIDMVPYESPIPSMTGRSYEPNHTYNDIPT